MKIDTNEMDAFKESFKYFKRKNPLPSLSAVIDFTRPKDFRNVSLVLSASMPNNEERKTDPPFHELGLKPVSQWKIFSLNELPGFYVIPNPFTSTGQHKWMHKCLWEYPKKPNMTNLDLHYNITADDNIWEYFINKIPGKDDLLLKLRWTTLGYHYNWDSKTYSDDRHTEFPTCLKNLVQNVAAALGYSKFCPEAAIINYYRLNSTLSGHTDVSERDLSLPLFSFSFGQTAVFLQGGKTKLVKPIPMFLRSGDIVIMSGESRLSYHGVPLILHEPWTEEKDPNMNNWNSNYEQDHVLEYMKTARINISVREVSSICK